MRIDCHAGTNAGLGKVYGGDVALLKFFQRIRKFGFEFIYEAATSGGGGIVGAGATDKDDRGGKGTNYLLQARDQFSSHWLSAANTEV